MQIPSTKAVPQVPSVESNQTRLPLAPGREPQMLATDMPKGAQKVDMAELEKVAKKMNSVLHLFNRSLQLEVFKFEGSGDKRIITRIVDTGTGSVVREFPSEELLEAFKRMDDLLGFLVDKKV